MDDQRYVTIGAACGAGLFLLLNLLTQGAVPGGFRRGLLGGLTAGALGVFVLVLRLRHAEKREQKETKLDSK